MKIILIPAIIYLISFVGAYFFIKKAHSKNGRWFNVDPELIDLLIILFPITNTILAFMFIVGTWERDFNYNFSNFFGVKK